MIAGVFDKLDGKIARATNTTSKFGVEYDSLADLISFGLAPGLMIYLWVLKPLGRIGWLAAFLFMACGALRLARFNTQVGNSQQRSFCRPAHTGGCRHVCGDDLDLLQTGYREQNKSDRGSGHALCPVVPDGQFDKIQQFQETGVVQKDEFQCTGVPQF